MPTTSRRKAWMEPIHEIAEGFEDVSRSVS